MTTDAADSARAAALAGHVGDLHTARTLFASPEPRTRELALGALARLGAVDLATATSAATDDAEQVRRRAGEVLAHDVIDAPVEALAALLLGLADDEVDLVAETAAWALGERFGAIEDEVQAPAAVIEALAVMAGDHTDPLCREAAVASLGAIGHPGSLAVIVAATTDKPAVRRRAVLALAPYLDAPEARAALVAAADDRDWQVRDAVALLSEGLDDTDDDTGT